jgi:cell division septation protein DedD
MLRTSDNETEILLGNKQLLGIFFAIAVLLGIAFTGGYMVGRGSGEKKISAASVPAGTAIPNANAAGGETHSVGATPNSDADENQSGEAAYQPLAIPATRKGRGTADGQAPLGSPKGKGKELKVEPGEEARLRADAATQFVPQPGQTFLQLAATSRDEAEAIADVLHRKGFRAHAVPKPGNPKLYRILIGPLRDAGDLSNTREALRNKAGFRVMIVQRY